MASFANLSANLKLNIQDFSSKLRVASTQVRRFAQNLNGGVVKSLKEVDKYTWKWGINLKSISRVVSGIVIAQTFYRIVQQVQQASAAVWEFTKQIETAQVAYSNLFGDASLAAEFINVLKDFAAKTPFSFTEAEAAAKRLLAYGIEYKNVMYVMQGVLSAASIQGDSTKIESISRALGQIYTYGKLMTQEVRQLSEAGIPAYEILQEELGLTRDQLANLGNEGIPAAEAINALIDGIQKRFGTAAEAASLTTTGIISNIKDNAVMLFSNLFVPLSTFIKSALADLGEFLFYLRDISEVKGIGGVFEALFPEEMHAVLRQFVATIQALGLAVARLVMSLSGLLSPVLNALILLFNAFAPTITLVANVLAELVNIITSNATAMKVLTGMLAAAAAMWVLYKVKAMASIVITGALNAVSAALAGLHTMLTFVLVHPFWSMLIVLGGVLIGLGGALVGLSGGFSTLGSKLNEAFKALTQFNGIDPDKVLLPSQKDRANDLDKFNNRLSETSDAMDDLADSTGKATKAAKGLLSFDEVFRLNQPDEGTGNGIDVPDFTDLFEGLDALGSGYMPEIPDFSTYMDALKGSFLDGFKSTWDSIMASMTDIMGKAIGAAFGGLMGSLLGGKIGGILGSIIGLLVGHFWDMLADYFGLEPDQRIRAGIIGGIGAAIGAILGGILGGPLGAKIGAIIGGLVGSFWGLLAEYLGVIPEQHISTLINGLISGLTQFGARLWAGLSQGLVATYTNDVFSGFSKMVGFSLKETLLGSLKQGVLGAIVGLATGILSNALTGWIAKELELTEQDLENSSVGQTIGNIIGSIVGFIVGGPAGSLIGGALGQVAGAVLGEFWTYMSTTLKGAVIGGAAGAPVGAIIGTLVGSIGGPLGMALGAVIGTALGAIVGVIVDNWEAIKQWFIDIGNGIAAFFADTVFWLKDGFNTLVDTIGDFFSGLVVTVSSIFKIIVSVMRSMWSTVTTVWNSGISTISTVLDDIWSAITTVWDDITSAITTVLDDIWSAITTVWNDINSAITTVLDDIWSAITTVWNDITSAITTVLTEIWDVISSIFYLIRDLVLVVVVEIWNTFVTWFNDIKDEVIAVFTALWTTVSGWFTDVWNLVSGWFIDVWDTVSAWFIDLWTTISEWFTNVWNSITEWFTNIWNTITEWLSNLWDEIAAWFTDLWEDISSWLVDIWNSISEWFSDLWNNITEWFTNIWTTVTEWLDDILEDISEWFADLWDGIKEWLADIWDSITEWFSGLWDTITDWFSNTYDEITGSIADWYDAFTDGLQNIYEAFTGWITDLWDNCFGKLFDWIDEGIAALRDFFNLGSEGSMSFSVNSDGTVSYGHATGGIFNREHVARFSEGNKAEAIIPLEEDTAMQPFVDAVANGLTASLAPILSNMNYGVAQAQTQMQPLYVGTLIADDRSLKELERKMEVIRLQESRR